MAIMGRMRRAKIMKEAWNISVRETAMNPPR